MRHGRAEFLPAEATPLYFHLISDEEIKRLAAILELLKENREAVLEHWYEVCTIHFGHDRTFSLPEFKKYDGADLDGVIEGLLAQDIVAMARSVREVGQQMVERGVPFAQIIAD